jgi:hypothetical protein
VPPDGEVAVPRDVDAEIHEVALVHHFTTLDEAAAHRQSLIAAECSLRNAALRLANSIVGTPDCPRRSFRKLKPGRYKGSASAASNASLHYSKDEWPIVAR